VKEATKNGYGTGDGSNKKGFGLGTANNKVKGTGAHYSSQEGMGYYP
jgi:hypothetical protein